VGQAELGFVLPHEHLIIDFRCRYRATGLDEVELPFDAGDRWRLVAAPAEHRVNLVRRSVEEAVYELAPFGDSGGRTIVDVTTRGLGPDRSLLASISRVTGIHVIAATGAYVHRSHDDWVHRATVDELTEWMVRDLTEGDDSGIMAGIIGEIGLDGPEPCESKVFEAAARASAETGAALSAHVLSGVLADARRATIDLIERFIGFGGDPGRLVLCHQDGSGADLVYQDEVASSGALLEYDTFGFETVFQRDGGYVQLPTDTQRIDEVAGLWERGFGHQVLLSHDICYRMMTRRWGGWGLGHLPISLRPRFEAAGVGPDEWHTMTVVTPGFVLSHLTESLTR
jgi:phosphotriesterase-related protein